ncbi:MAG: hypothetical protein ABW252_11860 [Polyangiales bacterium]
MKLWLPLTIALFVAIGGSAKVAHAARPATALGVRSLDGEDDLERRISHALRTSAAQLGELTVGDRVVSLEQMILSHGCDDADAACLAQIAQTLSVELLLYGEVVATRGAHQLTLHAYDAKTGRVGNAEARDLTAPLLAPGAIDQVLVKLLRQLLGITVSTKLRIESNRPGATVSVDGAPRGTLDERGTLVLDVPVGQRAVRVTEPVPEGRPALAEERLLTLSAGTDERLVLPLPEPPAVAPPVATTEPEAPPPRKKRSWRRIVGWSSVGVGAAFAVATIYSWVRLGKINDDADYTAYREKFPRGSSGADDVCRAAKRGTLAMRDPSSAALERTARDLCNEGDKLEALQYVFLGGTLLGAGAGTYLLLTAPKHDEPRATLQPRFGRGIATLEATLRF